MPVLGLRCRDAIGAQRLGQEDRREPPDWAQGRGKTGMGSSEPMTQRDESDIGRRAFVQGAGAAILAYSLTSSLGWTLVAAGLILVWRAVRG